MRARSCLTFVLAVLLTPACRESTANRVELAIATPPDFSAVAISNTYKQFINPQLILIKQYEVWIAIPPSDTANAGVVLPISAPVFIRRGDVLSVSAPGDIAPGDSLLVWHDNTVAYGSVQAPPGGPAYRGTQVVIVRHAG